MTRETCLAEPTMNSTPEDKLNVADGQELNIYRGTISGPFNGDSSVFAIDVPYLWSQAIAQLIPITKDGGECTIGRVSTSHDNQRPTKIVVSFTIAGRAALVQIAYLIFATPQS